MNRRDYLRFAIATDLIATALQRASAGAPPRVLVRSGWSSTNIGDIAQTFGMVHLLQQAVPQVDITLWPSSLDNGVEALLLANCPAVHVIRTQREFDSAKHSCDFFLHGSGPFLIERQLREWITEAGKPFGVYGISYDGSGPDLAPYVEASSFFFFRETQSLRTGLSRGLDPQRVAVAFDAAFALEWFRNDTAARAFLSANDLTPGQFVCCIPRLRWTPLWEINPKVPRDDEKIAYNAKMVDHDLSHLRAAVVAVVTQSPETRILVCHEDVTQIELGRREIVEKLPTEVLPSIVHRNTFWLPDEANSVYSLSSGLVSYDQHSPILCIASGVPAILFRSGGPKGRMWQDIGLGDWSFDLDDKSRMAIAVPTILDMVTNPSRSSKRAIDALTVVHDNQLTRRPTLSRALA